MSIWQTLPDPADLERALENTLAEHLDMRIEAWDDSSLTASMVVDRRTHQPMGLLHGGASVALAETVGSIASMLCVDRSRFYCVGQEINANHLRGVRSGRVMAVARPLHLGRSSHVWDIRLSDEEGRLTCVSRLTVAVVPLQRDAS
ncbi:1,4-dihydroxy-2-naphthoyl-CoA hydrolase [Pseudomonas sp. SORGH_AS199]|uniref:hotdog fold thioesterase n=1 Tax=Pseudomonas TaxID=286 RepID=UPI0021D807F6|nr:MULTISPECIES: hotdog fold thioesterase [Pseudomonas]MDR6231385.1 1,4-dihydroxy-2-naphthoyl-CoA hydrolase [Pseudomonas sp. SORGH_AS_0199]